MKVNPSVMRMCDKCKVIGRHGNLLVFCTPASACPMATARSIIARPSNPNSKR
jgi:ribosomal protein L36